MTTLTVLTPVGTTTIALPAGVSLRRLVFCASVFIIAGALFLPRNIVTLITGSLQQKASSAPSLAPSLNQPVSVPEAEENTSAAVVTINSTHSTEDRNISTSDERNSSSRPTLNPVRDVNISQVPSCPAPDDLRHSGHSVVPTTSPSLAFLFLVGTASNFTSDAWQPWFPPSSDPRYHIWVHTVPNASRINLPDFFCPYAIPSVETSYFWLLHGMLQLLQYSYRYSNATHFIFQSSSSMPLQHFNDLYDAIIRGGTKFCISADALRFWEIAYRELEVPRRFCSKAELWSVLSRRHAGVLLRHASTTLERWNRRLAELVREFPGREYGAPDETFFATLLQKEEGEVYDRASGGALFDTCPGAALGCCLQHHVSWPIDSMSGEWLSSSCRRMPGSYYRPCVFEQLWGEGLEKLREGGTMFMRKVHPRVRIELEGNRTVGVAEYFRMEGISWDHYGERRG